MDFTLFYKNAYEHDFDMMVGGWGGSAAYSNPYQLWHTSSWANKGSNFVKEIINLATDVDADLISIMNLLSVFISDNSFIAGVRLDMNSCKISDAIKHRYRPSGGRI